MTCVLGGFDLRGDRLQSFCAQGLEVEQFWLEFGCGIIDRRREIAEHALRHQGLNGLMSGFCNPPQLPENYVWKVDGHALDRHPRSLESDKPPILVDGKFVNCHFFCQPPAKSGFCG